MLEVLEMTKQSLNKLNKEELIDLILKLNHKSKENFEHELEHYLSYKEFHKNNKKIDDFEKASNDFTNYYSTMKTKYSLPKNCSLPLLYKTLTEQEFNHLAELEKKYFNAMEKM